jgi:Response regulator
MSGIKVQEELSRAGVYVPIVFVTGHADVAMAVRAMKAGAIDFLTSPSEARTYWMRFSRPWNGIVPAEKCNNGTRQYGNILSP